MVRISGSYCWQFQLMLNIDRKGFFLSFSLLGVCVSWQENLWTLSILLVAAVIFKRRVKSFQTQKFRPQKPREGKRSEPRGVIYWFCFFAFFSH